MCTCPNCVENYNNYNIPAEAQAGQLLVHHKSTSNHCLPENSPQLLFLLVLLYFSAQLEHRHFKIRVKRDNKLIVDAADNTVQFKLAWSWQLHIVNLSQIGKQTRLDHTAVELSVIDPSIITYLPCLTAPHSKWGVLTEAFTLTLSPFIGSECFWADFSSCDSLPVQAEWFGKITAHYK